MSKELLKNLLIGIGAIGMFFTGVYIDTLDAFIVLTSMFSYFLIILGRDLK